VEVAGDVTTAFLVNVFLDACLPQGSVNASLMTVSQVLLNLLTIRESVANFLSEGLNGKLRKSTAGLDG
jgi:hypothetical protein